MEQNLTLPGTTLADQQTSLYARINGYLKTYAFDLGDAVKKGQLVAEIDSPEVGPELRQARAQLASRSPVSSRPGQPGTGEVAADRWAGLVKEKAVSQQEADEKRLALVAREADVEAAKAAIKAQEANVSAWRNSPRSSRSSPLSTASSRAKCRSARWCRRAAGPGPASCSAWSRSSR